MSATRKITGATIAAAAAALFLAGCATRDVPTQQQAEVHCGGINSCKGTSACKTASNPDGPGQNACKGQGFLVTATAEDCTAQGGTVL